MRRLRAYVWVAGVPYGPGDSPPAEAAARITNPAAWAPDDSQESPAATPEGDDAPTPTKKQPAKTAGAKPAKKPGG